MGGIGHNSGASRRQKYTAAEIDAAIRTKIREDNIRPDSTLLQRARWELWLSRLSPRAKLVGLAIWEHADKDGSNAFPSMQRLLIMVGGSKRDLTAAIEEFCGWEYAEVVPGAGKRSNEYRFVLTVSDLADHLTGGNVVVPLRKRDGTTNSVAGTAVVPQKPIFSGTTVVPEESVAVPFSPVVVPSDPVSGTIPYISTRAFDLIDLKDLKGEERPRESGFGKMVAAVAASITTAVLPAAAAPQHPVEQVQQTVAECWQNPKARMDAGLNINEMRAQKQVWQTGTGLLEVTGDFKSELEHTYPLVDLKMGLAVAAAHVQPNLGALRMMLKIRERFAYMQSAAAEKQRRDAAFKKPVASPEDRPPGMPDKLWAEVLEKRSKANS